MPKQGQPGLHSGTLKTGKEKRKKEDRGEKKGREEEREKEEGGRETGREGDRKGGRDVGFTSAFWRLCPLCSVKCRSYFTPPPCLSLHPPTSLFPSDSDLEA